MADVVAKHPVAFFDILTRVSPDDEFSPEDFKNTLEIRPNSEFFIGRSPECPRSCSDPTVSLKHLHVHCIIFDEEAEPNPVPPLVYIQDFSTNGTYLTRAGRDPKFDEQQLSRRDGKVLLGPGDIIRISPTLALYFRYAGTIDSNANRLSSNPQHEAELFADRYTITNQVLGQGGYGAVFAAVHKKKNYQLACKVVDLTLHGRELPPRPNLNDVTNQRNGSPVHRKHKPSSRRDAILSSQEFREFDILQHLDHPNIVHLEKVFWSENTIFIFQELITSGDLFSYIAYRQEKLPDVEASVIVYQILKGVEYLHDQNIVHRDLKPDNILISTNFNASPRVIITDFGACRRIDPVTGKENQPNAGRMRTFMGTLDYIAPEMYASRKDSSKSYTKAVDIWSVGVITTMVLTSTVIFQANALPIPGRDHRKIMAELTANCDLSIMDRHGTIWEDVGKRPKDFVRHLLVVDETQRYTVKQALLHPWFTNHHYHDLFMQAYEKAIAGWQPRKRSFRVIEALDLTRLASTQGQQMAGGRSRFFEELPYPFPQGERHAPPVRSPSHHAVPALPTIGEEATPEPSQESIMVPSTPAPKNTDLPTGMQDVENSLEKMDLDPSNPLSETSTDIAPGNVKTQIDDTFDLDAPYVPTKAPRRKIENFGIALPKYKKPMPLKRPCEVDLADKCDSSTKFIAEQIAYGEKPAKKFKPLR